MSEPVENLRGKSTRLTARKIFLGEEKNFLSDADYKTPTRTKTKHFGQ
jgi:hypothetical protein